MADQTTIITHIQDDGGIKRVEQAVASVNRMLDALGKRANDLQAVSDKISNSLNAQLKLPPGTPGRVAGQILQSTSQGTTVGGRIRTAQVAGQKADMRQLEAIVAADIQNFRMMLMQSMTKAVKNASISGFAMSRQNHAIEGQIAEQIKAQEARVAASLSAASRRAGARLGMGDLGSTAQEKAALNALLTAQTRITQEKGAEKRETQAILRLEEQIQRMQDRRFEGLRNETAALRINQRLAQESVKLAQAQGLENKGEELKIRMRMESIRLQQMALRGVKEETQEWRTQMDVIRRLNGEIIANKNANKTTPTARPGRTQEDILGSMVAGRKAASTLEGRASLMGLQSNLLLNYSLLGGATSAFSAMGTSVVDLDAKLRELQAIAGATNGEFEGMRKAVLKASEDTKFSAVELADASIQLAQVGLSVREIEDTLPVIARFAMAVGTDIKNAVDITTTTMTVFNMRAEEAGRIANVLTEALNRSKLSMEQLQVGFQYAANIAADSGVSFEELTATLAGMSQAGIRSGSMLGTGLRQILISLANPTDDLKALLKQLGLSMNDVDVRTQGLTGVLENFAAAGITAGEAMSAFETRTAAALVAATNQVDFIRSVQEQFAYTTAAEEAAAVQQESFKNSVAELKNEFLSFFNDAARPMLEILIDFSKAFKALGDAMGPAAPLLKGLTSAFLILMAALGVASVARLTVAFVQFSGVIPMILSGLTSLGATFSLLSTAMVANATFSTRLAAAWTVLKMSGGAIVVAIAAVAAGIAAVVYAMKDHDSAASKFTKSMDESKTKANENRAAFDKYMQILSQIDGTIARVRDRSQNMKDGSEELRIEIMNGANAFNQYGAAIDASRLSLEEYIRQLQAAKANVIALAEEQAKKTVKEDKRTMDTAGLDYTSARNMFETRNGNPEIIRRLLSNNLGANESAQAIKAFELISATNRSGKTPEQLQDSGQLTNVMAAAATITRLLAEVKDPKLQALAADAQRLRFAGGRFGSARVQYQSSNDISTGLSLMSDPKFQAMTVQFSDTMKSVQTLSEELAKINADVRSGAMSPAQARQRTESTLQRYGKVYRGADSQIEALSSQYTGGQVSAAERYAYDRTMDPVNQSVNRLREILTSTQRALDENLLKALDQLEQLANTPNIKLEMLLSAAKEYGLNPVGKSKEEVKDWLAKMRAGATTNNNLGSLLGGTGAAAANLDYRTQLTTIQYGGAVSTQGQTMTDMIKRAAELRGLDAEVMLTIAKIESQLDPKARNRSGASGLYQFMPATWAGMGGGDVFDPSLNIDRAMTLTRQNQKGLRDSLGRDPRGWELYLAHQQGLGGAKSLLGNPNMLAMDALKAGGSRAPRASILQNGGTLDMTSAQFAAMWRRKYAEFAQSPIGEGEGDISKSTKEAAEAARDLAIGLSERIKGLATSLRRKTTVLIDGLNDNTDDYQASLAVTEAENTFEKIRLATTQSYDIRIEALTKYRDTMDSAGQLTADQFNILSEEIETLEEQKAADLAKARDDTIAQMSELYTRLPQYIGAIREYLEDITQALEAAQQRFEASKTQTALTNAVSKGNVLTEYEQRAVASGEMTQAQAEARAATRARKNAELDTANNPARAELNREQLAMTTATLDSQAGDTGMRMRDITAERLAKEKEVLATMSKEDDGYAWQATLVKEMEDHLVAVTELRAKERDLLNESAAIQEAQLLKTQTMKEKIGEILQGWSDAHSGSLSDGLLNGIPEVLDTAQGAFAQFFSDIMTGTASVQDAFRAMGTAILKAMMDIVASEAAKALIKLLLRLAKTAFGYSGGGTVSDSKNSKMVGGFARRAAGGPSSIAAMRGFIPAAAGMPGRDSVPILAMPGEFVLRKSAVDAIGADNLDRINANGNRMLSSESAGVSGAAKAMAPQNDNQPLNVYVVSPDRVPPTSKTDIVIAIQEDMVNKGPVYKMVRAANKGML